MNTDETIAVLARIEDEQALLAAGKSGVGFNMASWFSKQQPDEKYNICGSVACLAGHAAIYKGYEATTSDYFRHPETDTYHDVEELGCEILGITAAQGSYLFYLNNLAEVYEYIAGELGVDIQVLADKVQAARE